MSSQKKCLFSPAFLLVGVVFLVTGCAAPSLDLSLKPVGSFAVKGTAAPIVIGVDEFIDQRPLTRGDDNQKWRGFIPGVLWIEISTDMPEIYTPFSPFNSPALTRNLSESFAGILSDYGMTEQVVLLSSDPYRQVDYRLEGVLLRSQVVERCYYYGSFMYAWLTRVFGLPYVSYEIELSLQLRLRDLATNRIVWQGSIEGHRSDRYHSVYNLSAGRNGKHLIAADFADILADGLPEVLVGIRGALSGEISH
ncbi:MAG: hypothetical protein KJ950_00580 [Proteobacteria bacterium]|nr:hypothetical protein [Pseudomonadota bacterium]MBU1685848.1 hypothetical protein [Pseudomonadota bacterium]